MCPISYIFALNNQGLLFLKFLQTSPQIPHTSLQIFRMLHLHRDHLEPRGLGKSL